MLFEWCGAVLGAEAGLLLQAAGCCGTSVDLACSPPASPQAGGEGPPLEAAVGQAAGAAAGSRGQRSRRRGGSSSGGAAISFRLPVVHACRAWGVLLF